MGLISTADSLIFHCRKGTGVNRDIIYSMMFQLEISDIVVPLDIVLAHWGSLNELEAFLQVF